jgi:fucose permease
MGLDQPGAGQFVRDRSAWFAYVMLGYYAYFLNGLGPLTPFLRTELNLAYTVASFHFSAFAAGMLVAGLTAERSVARIGRQGSIWLGASGLAVGVLLLIFGRHPGLTIAGALLMGMLGTLILAIVPAALSDRFGRLRAIALMEANVAGSACAALAPFAIGFSARAGFGWRPAMVLPILALVPIYAIFRHQTVSEPPPRPASSSASGRLSRAYWAYWGVLVLVVSVEFCFVFWAAEFLRTSRGITPADAALATSLFLGAMLAGRIIGSGLLRRAQGIGLLLGALGLAAAGFVLQWQTHAVPSVAAGLAISGLGVANLYPLALSLAVGAVPGQADAAAARASLASGTAILALPLLLGRMADLVGITTAYGLIGLLIAAATAMVIVARTLTRHEARLSVQHARTGPA